MPNKEPEVPKSRISPLERAKTNLDHYAHLLIIERDREFLRLVSMAENLDHLRELMKESGIVESDEIPM